MYRHIRPPDASDRELSGAHFAIGARRLCGARSGVAAEHVAQVATGAKPSYNHHVFSSLLALFALDRTPVETPQLVRPSADGVVSVIVLDSEHCWHEAGCARLDGARVAIYPDGSSPVHARERPIAFAVSGRTGWADVLIEQLPPGSYRWRVERPHWESVQGRMVIGAPLEAIWDCMEGWPADGALHQARLTSCLRRTDRQEGTGFMVETRRGGLDDGRATQLTTLTREELRRVPF